MFPPMEYYSTCGLSEENTILKFGEDNVEENVIGLHVMGPSAGEVFQGFAVALRCGLIKQQLDTPVRLHPVCAQVLTNLTITQRATDAMMVRGNS
ncbi:thioredoxin reductase 1, cytoplasmic-like [Oncorhynchus tshawytscha]|uniref:thioredoxin reductase 1, cytoplasmic-like n=1 Tax=Oncorhynchus tshawytscha TaxID=74940 RepID=UPI001C3E269F|nr:thioredoxin reductase 1, cytoplasmic-like [Oncorhynchus tshawytscha]